jgi:hypothetical protein
MFAVKNVDNLPLNFRKPTNRSRLEEIIASLNEDRGCENQCLT